MRLPWQGRALNNYADGNAIAAHEKRIITIVSICRQNEDSENTGLCTISIKQRVIEYSTYMDIILLILNVACFMKNINCHFFCKEQAYLAVYNIYEVYAASGSV
ncbi:hypothetical protein [Shewanella sp. AC91-MNA-CIBAN-0169]|uniref:hypothetical protein n=1 Tax=Shewanella sp. AC91-MNA-CIBAN-0169 TaxID=3140466 RepID=UPI003333BB1F